MRRGGFATRIVMAILAVFLVLPTATRADWPSNPAVNLGVCQGPGDQIVVRIADDGTGGALLAWSDDRNANLDLYGARVRLDGSKPWPRSGQPLADSTQSDYGLDMESDGAGGVLLAWKISPSSVYAQRIDDLGARMWGQRGVLIATNAVATQPQVVHDGAGGAIVIWSTCRSCPDADIVAQRISADGGQAWPVGGVMVVNGLGYQDDLDAVTDGAGGAFVAWGDRRGGVYAQHLDGGGQAVWTQNGVPVDNTYGLPYYNGFDPHLAADEGGGVFIIYLKNESVGHVYAQHLGSSGQALWNPAGVYFPSTYNGYGRARIVPDGTGGAIVGYDDSGENYTLGGSDVHAARIGANGTFLWNVNVCVAPLTQRSTQVIADGAGGAYLVWQDSRVTQDFGPYDIFAQRLDPTGNALWTADGIAVCSALDDQRSPVAVRSGVGGILVGWEDERGKTADVFAQHVGPNGTLGLVVSDASRFEPGTGLHLRLASPVRDAVSARFHLNTRAEVILRVYDITGRTRSLRPLGLLPAGEQAIGVGIPGLPSGVYVVSLTAQGNIESRKVVVMH